MMMIKKRRITKGYFYIARLQYVPLIQRLSFFVGENSTQREEMIVRADEELLKCMICYNHSSSFMTFLYCRLMGAFRHMKDADNRAKRIHNISSNNIATIADPHQDNSIHVLIQDCLECLNDSELNIITELFFNEKTMRDISNSSEKVASTIYRIKTRAMEKMKRRCTVGLE